jgi:GPH family glycoside/pentoside/hexuronide:cation symporter
MGLVGAEVLIELYLLKFYNVAVGLPPFYTALALGVAMVWDAVSDPLMGEISDQTAHRAGRRRPYLLPGALALALTLAVIFNPPGMESTAAKFIFLLCSYLGITTAMTVIGVPHLALGGELSFDRDERTEIFGYRRLFTTLGLLVGVLLPALALRMVDGDDGQAQSRGIAAIAAGFLIVATAAITFHSTRGLDHGLERRTDSLRLGHLLRAQIGVARSRTFRWLLIAFIVAGLGRAINASLALYYYEYRLQLTESDTILYILLPFFLSILVSIPGWVYLSRRFGKRGPAVLGVLGLGVLISIFYPILPAGRFEGPIFIAILGGLFGGSLILLESLVADVVDVDELETGFNREGLYFGMWRMGTKLSRAGGIVLSGILLHVIGFDADLALQAPDVASRIGWIFGPGVGALLVLGALLLLRFPLSDEAHRRIQRQLSETRARRAEAGGDVR